MRKIRRLRELSGHERLLLLQALWMLPLARLSLALTGFGRTDRLFQRMARVGPRALDAREVEDFALATARMVRVAAVYGVCGATCLPRSLVASTLLRGAGLEPVVRLGARKKDGVVEAHAWVVVGGVAIGGDDGEPFSPFAAGKVLNGRDNATC